MDLVRVVVNRAQRARSIHEKMFMDDMTGLLTRKFLLQELDRHLNAYQRDFGDVCFCMCDLDNFKAVNDTYGHLAGDMVIKGFSSLVKSRLRKT